MSWGWYYLSTVLDDYSRYIVAWTLRTSMQASDVTETLDLARAATGVDQVRVEHRPRLLSDNGPCYVSTELATYLETHQLTHTRGGMRFQTRRRAPGCGSSPARPRCVYRRYHA